jgi:hypothetical protein
MKVEDPTIGDLSHVALMLAREVVAMGMAVDKSTRDIHSSAATDLAKRILKRFDTKEGSDGDEQQVQSSVLRGHG